MWQILTTSGCQVTQALIYTIYPRAVYHTRAEPFHPFGGSMCNLWISNKKYKISMQLKHKPKWVGQTSFCATLWRDITGMRKSSRLGTRSKPWAATCREIKSTDVVSIVVQETEVGLSYPEVKFEYMCIHQRAQKGQYNSDLCCVCFLDVSRSMPCWSYC